MRFNISTLVLAVAASTGVMAAPVAEPEANAHALERRGPPISKLLKNPSVMSGIVTAVMSVLAGGKVLLTDFDEETDVEDEVDEQQVPTQDSEDYYNNPGTVPLVPSD